MKSLDKNSLPVYQARLEIIKHIQDNPVVIIVGETGSGKTTQIPQFLYKQKWANKGKIAITQPRRVAAISIANRVAQEVGCKLGDMVGYSIRFEDVTSQSTKIKYLTDGMLLRELLNDSKLSQYSVVILDEAHERTLRTDILFGMVKSIQKNHRPDLKIIIMSATLNADKFSEFFNDAKVLYIEGRSFPVKIFHSNEPLEDYLDSALVSVFQIHQEQPPGDILVFLTGQEEIESAEKILNEGCSALPKNCLKLLVCPIFASMPSAHQSRVFSATPPGFRKVILSTNIAETSITISGVRYVIDTGMVKVRNFNPNIGLENLSVQPISRASAEQRAGRAGRESAGSCYRLYTADSFMKLQQDMEPEIYRVNLASVILTLKASGVDDVVNFEYIDRPSKSSLYKALETLYALNALDDSGRLTDIGRTMAQFPLDPQFAKMILESMKFECVAKIIDIVSILSIDSIFFNPLDKREEARAAMLKFLNFEGDHLTYLNVLDAFCAENRDSQFCQDHYLKKRSMNQVMEIREQLRSLCIKMNMSLESPHKPHSDDVLIKCLLSGLFLNVAVLQLDGSYRTLISNQTVYIHPSSTLFGKKSPAILFNELVHTSRKFMRKISRIDKEWLLEVAPHYYGRHSH